MLANAHTVLDSSPPKARSSLALLKSIQALGKNTRGGLKILKKPSETIPEQQNEDKTDCAHLTIQNFK